MAVLRKRPAMVLALLDAGFPVTAKNAHQWSALEDAAALKDKELVKILHTREISSLKAELKAKKESLLTSLNEIPDCTFQVNCFPLQLSQQIDLSLWSRKIIWSQKITLPEHDIQICLKLHKLSCQKA